MEWWTWLPRHGVVVERSDARLIELSPGGCRLEMARRLLVGQVALVEIATSAARVVEVARVCHSTERPGAAVRHVAHLQFLPVPIAQRASAAAAVAAEAVVRGAPLAATGERSASSQTAGSSLALAWPTETARSGRKTGPRNDARDRSLHKAALATPLNISASVDAAGMGGVHGRHGEPAREAHRNEGLDE